MNAQYYVWADGVENGPLEFKELFAEWRSGKLPKGFLWRREDQESFQAPDDLIEEEKSVFAPPPKVPIAEKPKVSTEISAADHLKRVRSGSQYKQLRFWLWVLTGCISSAGISLSIEIADLFSRVRNEPNTGYLIVVVGCLASVSIAAAVDQAARLAIDAVDLMIDRGRKGC